MLSCPIQEPNIPEIVDTYERTSTDQSRAVMKRILEQTQRSYASSQYLTAQSCFSILNEQLDQLGHTAANWNSYGSPAPSKQAIANAKPVLQALRARLLQPERLLPSADGGVAFTFVSDKPTRAAIESLNNGETYVLFYDLFGRSETIDWPADENLQRELVGTIATHLRSESLAAQRA